MNNNERYKGYEIVLEQDNDPMNPREDDNLGTMLCMHRNYSLGDDPKAGREEISDHLEGRKKDIAISLPLYLYDHSGITISTSPFSCPWDSGIVGTIFVNKEKVRKWYGIKRITKAVEQKVVESLKSEVKVYDDYLTGNVYCMFIKKDDEILESMGGWWGDSGLKDAIAEAKSTIDCWEQKQSPNRLELELKK